MDNTSQPTSQVIYVQRNGEDVEVLVCGRIQTIDGKDLVVFTVEDMEGGPIELTLAEYTNAASELYDSIIAQGLYVVPGG